MYDFAKVEGLDKEASAEFEALKAKLMPDMTVKLNLHRDDIEELLSAEIIKRYYYQKGVIAYSLQNDVELKTAIQLLSHPDRYDRFFRKEISLK